MTTLKTAALTLALFVAFSATAYGQNKHAKKPCVVHVLTQGGSPNAPTVLVCG